MAEYGGLKGSAAEAVDEAPQHLLFLEFSVNAAGREFLEHEQARRSWTAFGLTLTVVVACRAFATWPERAHVYACSAVGLGLGLEHDAQFTPLTIDPRPFNRLANTCP